MINTCLRSNEFQRNEVTARSVLRSPDAVIVRPFGPFVCFVVSRMDRRMSTSGEQRSLGTESRRSAACHSNMPLCMQVRVFLRM